MGSTTPVSLPDASSASLILTQPTEEERIRTWSLTHPTWGPALSHDEYLRREAYLITVPLAKDGGFTHWILTDSSLPPNGRPILSSCETLRKKALSCKVGPDGNAQLVDGIAHGIGSVFTDPQFRGRGYASRMMRELGPRLQTWKVKDMADTERALDDEDQAHSLFSVLYSDIGKLFYAKHGWAAFDSSHAAFPPVSGAASGVEPHNGYASTDADAAKPIGYHELAELCAADEKLLRKTLVQRAEAAAIKQDAKHTSVALVPNLDNLLWHLMREDFMTKYIFGRTPSVKGALWGTEPGRRMWAVWTRGYYGGLEKTEGNTLYVLRFVVEDDSAPHGDLLDGFRSIMRIAQAEAAGWRSQDVQMWNPTPKVRKLVEECGLAYEFVVRDSESIASLMWYGDGETAALDWVANEKFGWC